MGIEFIFTEGIGIGIEINCTEGIGIRIGILLLRIFPVSYFGLIGGGGDI